MTKTLAATSRRSLLRAGAGAALGAALGGLRLGDARAAVLRGPGEICRKDGDCAAGVCLPKDASGRRRCGCADVSDCAAPVDGGVCLTVACEQGACVTTVNTDAVCGQLDLCTTTVPTCQADGSCAGTPTTCTALSQCHEAGVCDPQTGDCSNPTKLNGTPCETGVPHSSGATCQDGSCVCTPHGTDCGAKQCGPGFTTCGQATVCGICDIGYVCNDQTWMCDQADG
jgi:hypothetical protein